LNRFWDRYPILKYIVFSFGKFFLYVLGTIIVIFPILYFTGLYSKVQNLLDLKYNSPFVMVPLFGCLALAVISFLVGALLYFHKYKRNKVKSVFSKNVGKVLVDKDINSKRRK